MPDGPSATTVRRSASTRLRRARRLAPVARVRARRYVRLPLREQLMFVRYVADAVVLEAALRLAKPNRLIPRWAAAAHRRRERRGAPAGRSLSPQRRHHLMTRAGGITRPGRSCLPVALLLWRDTLTCGENTELVIGVRTDPTFAAHAWVQRPDGTVLDPAGSGTHMTRLAVWSPDGTVRSAQDDATERALHLPPADPTSP
ncbi:MAG: lasso peptide biosynthesis B2 protein [Acidimicrobiales bacterium]|nr:lasso peptide biosynthesis B2 protein [Acidimicrobiales bacterium]